MNIVYGSCVEVENLAAAFECCTLPRDRWNHRAHLMVGLWYLLKHPKAKATGIIREGIKRYNESVNILTTKTTGYHETITLFYVELIHNFLKQATEDKSIAQLANELLNAYGDKKIPLKYYTEERLMSWEARTSWVAPDLKPLDFGETLFRGLTANVD